MPSSNRRPPLGESSEDDDWHALPLTEVERRLGTGVEGVSPQEAEIRLARHGPNRLEEVPPPSALALLVHQFRSPLIYILLVATIVTILLEEFVDAGVIAAVLLLNAAIGFFQERKAEQSVRALMQLVSPHARVIRAGREWDIESAELVPGDLVLLESGTRVPADLRLWSARGLTVDESLLTGESIPVSKRSHEVDRGVVLADRSSMAYTGTVVASGRGRGYTVATGPSTELGKIATQVREEAEPTTPLQQRMVRFAQLVGVVVAFSAALAFGAGILLGESPADMFKVGVALAVSAVPEGLPVVFTITLALGVRRMAQRNAIIRRLPAVETLGSTTAIGSDKTGTLTENRMTVEEVWTAGRVEPLERESREEGPPAGFPLHLTLLAGVLASEAEAYRTAEGLETHGDPTEAALLVAAARAGVEPSEARAEWTEEAEIPFEPELRYSASFRSHDGRHRVFVKGAPERIAEMCHLILTGDGARAIDPATVHEAARSMASRGLRVLAMAYAELDGRPDAEDLPEPAGLTFLGLQGMRDPPRSGVRDAILGCQRAGIRVVMITGDHALTARAIASELGIAGENALVLTGTEVETMDDEELGRRVQTVAVYARMAPEHKFRVVRLLRSHGEVVAVTGDGVNDAPALKAADIGIAMGKSGTDVAREAADMVLADDNFVSIHAAVEEGRVTFDNLRKVTFFLISSGAAEVLMILVALFLGWPLPILPAQILWLNLVTNGLQDVALAFEPGEPDVLDRPPRSRREGVVSALLWERTVVAGIVMAAGTLLLFRWELDHGTTIEEARTIALTTMVVFQALHAGNSRSERRSAFALSPFSNRFLLLAVVGALAVHAAALYLPPTRFVLRVEPIAFDQWVEMGLVAISIVVAVEIHKLLRRGRTGQEMQRS